MAQDPRNSRDISRNIEDKTKSTTTCSMVEFFKAYTQLMMFVISGVFILIILSLILMFSIPPYLNWTAKQSIQRQELLGMAELARKAQEAEVVVEQAHADAVAMGIIATGQRSAASSKAEAIRIVGDAANRYKEYANDEYLLSLANSNNRGDRELLEVEK